MQASVLISGFIKIYQLLGHSFVIVPQIILCNLRAILQVINCGILTHLTAVTWHLIAGSTPNVYSSILDFLISLDISFMYEE